MKVIKLAFVAVAIAAGFTAGYVRVQGRLDQQQQEFSKQRAAWESEKAALEAELEKARMNKPAPQAPSTVIKTVEVKSGLSASEILERLKVSRAVAGQPRGVRQVLSLFEQLIECGQSAIEPIRRFLARNEDVEYDPSIGRRLKGRLPTSFDMPPSLRLGLFEVVKNIGGAKAEETLAEVLQTTGRGIEVAYLAAALEEMAPGKYRQAALAAARELLAKPLTAGSTSPLDKLERDCLYGVLSLFNDSSYALQAKTELVRDNGKIDPVPLAYLQQTQGKQAIGIVAETWKDSRLAASQREPLARYALGYVGDDPQAEQLYQDAINDTNLSADQRRNLIEDLNEEGYDNLKDYTQRDCGLIESRIALIERLAPKAADKVNDEAFKEAYKDLLNMREECRRKAGGR